jgi:hypothetical protein
LPIHESLLKLDGVYLTRSVSVYSLKPVPELRVPSFWTTSVPRNDSIYALADLGRVVALAGHDTAAADRNAVVVVGVVVAHTAVGHTVVARNCSYK